MAVSSNSPTFDDAMCIICRVPFSESKDVDISEVSRGLDRLIEFSEKCNDTKLNEYLRTKPPVVRVHNSCRRTYTNKRRLESNPSKDSAEDATTVKSKSLRSCTPSFDFKMHCYFCNELCVNESKDKIRRVETLELRDIVLAQCSKRSDAWGLTVQGRLLTCCDLVAEEAIYHKNCYRSFFRIFTHASRGRPVDSMKADTFEKLCEWLEVNDFELLTLEDVVNKARVLVPANDSVYSEQWMKKKLIKKYGDHIQFNEVRGRRNVICWKEMASFIVNQKWHDDKNGDQSEHIIIKAAKLLKATIREATYSMDSYPTCEDVRDPQRASDWIPSLLRTFLDHLICPEAKKIAVGHSIVQAVRPRSVIAPIPFAVGVSIDHVTASKYLLNLFSRLGMSVSYDEVYRFKQSVARCEASDPPPSFPDSLTQFAADNVDHDCCTLDGSGTLHAMGIISISNSLNADSLPYAVRVPEVCVPRLKLLKSADVAKLKRIPLIHCSLPDDSMAGIAFKPGFHANLPYTLPPSVNLDLLWHTGWFVRKDGEPRPSWAGFNDSVIRGHKVCASDIRMQPIIDLNPNDLSCIYSTLVFITKEAEKLNIKTPLVTFDQPLWLKAMNIVNCHQLNIVVRLGAFHVQMSYLGSIGTLMAGSGLSEIMECCYGVNTVKHINSGKAVARAVRAHFLIESALTIMLLKSVMSSDAFEPQVKELQQFYERTVSSGQDVKTDEHPDSLSIVEQALNVLKTGLAKLSRTAKLWLQYLNYISTLKLLLRAERTADWQLHLISIRRMINLFAATGHNNYAKCARLYVEVMTELPDTHPEVYEQFMTGNHVARRSNKFWAGISTDLTIEQAMMRALKGRGGLTHGRGVTESVRTTWVSSVHKTAAIKTALAQLTDLEYRHDEVQHPELGKSRSKRDNDDLSKILEFLDLHNPFDTTDPRLHSLTSGIAAADSDNVNCDEAEEVGSRIMLKMDGVKFKDVSLKRSDHVRTLAHVTNAINAPGKKTLNIDPTMLFNRLLIIMQRSPNTEPYFAYELSGLPTSLFKDQYMRKTEKSQLAKELVKNIESASVPKCDVHVVDGGYLLHVVHWNEGYSYADVAQQYVTYVGRHYGQHAVVVFDGYCTGPSTKDQEHQRRAHKFAPDIILDENKTAYLHQAAFLANEHNKAAFVKLLITCLQSAGYIVHQAADDADTLVVKVALELAVTSQVVGVVANDTDILILLLYHFRPHMCDIFMFSKSNQRINSVRDIVAALGTTLVSQLLLIHSVSGCDTTSCLFGHGKASVLKKLSKSTNIKPLLDVLESSTASHEDVMQAGCGLLALLYGGTVKDKLNHLRYSSYMHITATSTQLPRPERLPPTENAARYHVYRVHLQILQWKLLSTTVISPEDWGWKLHEGKYIPVATDIEIAPADILKVACCKCSAESKKPCGTLACQCRKYGLSCVTACKNCNGTSCENASDISQEFTLDEDDPVGGSSAEDADIFDIDDEDIIDPEYLEYYMPWEIEEEEVVTSVT